MTRAVEPGRDTPARIIRFHQVQGPHRAVAEHDLSATGRGQLPPGRYRWAHMRSAGSRRR